ncbi:MAG: hypothetical protein RLZZ292_2760, partial [Bacteroidota bacterium]
KNNEKAAIKSVKVEDYTSYNAILQSAKEVIDTLTHKIIVSDDITQNDFNRKKVLKSILNSLKPNPLIRYLKLNISEFNKGGKAIELSNRDTSPILTRIKYLNDGLKKPYVVDIKNSTTTIQPCYLLIHTFQNQPIVKDGETYNYSIFITNTPLYSSNGKIVISIEQFLPDSIGKKLEILSEKVN